MTAVDDLACLPIIAAPEGQRFPAHQGSAARFPADDDPAQQYYVSHDNSSRMISPATAELTQSSRLPNAIFFPSSPGA